jgi:single-strand DNA-binding protein
MSIPTQMSLAGFIATDPDLHFTTAGAEYVRFRVGVEQWRKEVDDSFTKLGPSFHDMVAFESTARELYARFGRAIRLWPAATCTSTRSSATAGA